HADRRPHPSPSHAPLRWHQRVADHLAPRPQGRPREEVGAVHHQHTDQSHDPSDVAPGGEDDPEPDEVEPDRREGECNEREENDHSESHRRSPSIPRPQERSVAMSNKKPDDANLAAQIKPLIDTPAGNPTPKK